MKKGITVTQKNIYPIMQSAIKKLKEQSETDRMMTEEYARLLNWTDEAIVFGKANGMIK